MSTYWWASNHWLGASTGEQHLLAMNIHWRWASTGGSANTIRISECRRAHSSTQRDFLLIEFQLPFGAHRNIQTNLFRWASSRTSIRISIRISLRISLRISERIRESPHESEKPREIKRNSSLFTRLLDDHRRIGELAHRTHWDHGEVQVECN